MYPQLSEQDLFKLSTTPNLALGTVFIGDQGRKKYKYVAFGGTATIAPGTLLVAPAAPTNTAGLALATANTPLQLSAGSKQLIVVNGGTAVTPNEFAEGILEILGANGGFSVRIAGNSGESTGTGNITFTLEEPLRNTSALVAGTNTVTIVLSDASAPAASITVAAPVGVTVVSVPNTAAVVNYGFVQVGGDCLVSATTATKGYNVVQDTTTTAGNVANSAATTAANVGVCRESASGGVALVNLRIV